MAVSRTKTNGYDIKGAGELISVTSGELIFRDKNGDSTITLDEISALIGKEITFTVKVSEKEVL